jgi:hypothetical protein
MGDRGKKALIPYFLCCCVLFRQHMMYQARRSSKRQKAVQYPTLINITPLLSAYTSTSPRPSAVQTEKKEETMQSWFVDFNQNESDSGYSLASPSPLKHRSPAKRRSVWFQDMPYETPDAQPSGLAASLLSPRDLRGFVKTPNTPSRPTFFSPRRPVVTPKTPATPATPAHMSVMTGISPASFRSSRSTPMQTPRGGIHSRSAPIQSPLNPTTALRTPTSCSSFADSSDNVSTGDDFWDAFVVNKSSMLR